MKNFLFVIVPVLCWAEVHSEVILTGILDGTLTGGKPKAIELFIAGTEDLGGYEIWRSQNGDPFGAGLGSIAALSGTYSNTFVYLVKSDQVGEFQSVFGSYGFYAHVIPLALVSGNGNEGFQIRDTVGDVVVDQVWLENPTDSYRDSFWYRDHGTGPDGNWEVAHWWSPGNDALDGLDEAGLRAAVPFGTYGLVWRGFTTDWNNPLNWSPEPVPGPDCNVFVHDTAVCFPVIANDPSAPAECFNLTVADSACVTVAPEKALTVHGDLNLTGPQMLVRLLLQSATGNAPAGSLIVAGAALGVVSAQRYLAKDNSWHFLSSPVVGQLLQPAFIPDPVDNSFDFYSWQEAAPLDSGWINCRDISGALNPAFDTTFMTGKGYLAAYSGNNSGDPMRQFSGVPNVGNCTLSLGHSGNHWNLLGNPYTCALDWSSPGVERSDVAGGAMYIWDQALNSGAGAYRTHNASSGVPQGTTPFIPAMNGFFVKSLAEGQLTIDAGYGQPLVHGTQNFYRSSRGEGFAEIRLRIFRDGFADETLIVVNGAASNGYDPLLDAPKLPNGISEAPEISSTAEDSIRLCINSIGSLPAHLPLAVDYGHPDTVHLEVVDPEGLVTTAAIFLEDLVTGISQDMRENPVYSFLHSPQGSPGRFMLHLQDALAAQESGDQGNPLFYISGQTIFLLIESGKSLPYRIFDTAGRIVSEGIISGSLDISRLPHGVYIVELKAGKTFSRNKVLI